MSNVLVKSADDFTILGLIDLEWVYAGPAQLFGSAPWWLMLDRPMNLAWAGSPPELVQRYSDALDLYQRVLEEEEVAIPDCQNGELSSLLRWSRASGAMWLHMLLPSGFICALSFPCLKLKQYVGEEPWKAAWLSNRG